MAPYYYHPNTIGFPIFWLPILLPLMVSALGLAVELGIRSRLKSESSGSTVLRGTLLLVGRNANFAFVSTDLWALTTLFMASAKEEIGGLAVVGLGFGVIIGLLAHIFFFVLCDVVGSRRWGASLAIVVAVVGAVGVFMIRDAIFHRIELPDLANLQVSSRCVTATGTPPARGLALIR